MKYNVILLFIFIISSTSCSKNDDSSDSYEITNSIEKIATQDFEFEGKVYTLSVDISNPDNALPIKDKNFQKLSKIFEFPNLIILHNGNDEITYLYRNEVSYKKSSIFNTTKRVEEDLEYGGGGGGGGGISTPQIYATWYARDYFNTSGGWSMTAKFETIHPYNYIYINDFTDVSQDKVYVSNLSGFNVNDDASSFKAKNVYVKSYQHQNKDGKVLICDALNGNLHDHDDLDEVKTISQTGFFNFDWNDVISSAEIRTSAF